MKPILTKVVFCFCMFVGTASAQTSYFHYLDYTSQWHLFMQSLDFDFNCNNFSTINTHINYSVAGDTLAGGNWYYKLQAVRIDSTICPGSVTVDTSYSSQILIREDESKRIYKRSGNTEYMLWDFSFISVGQTIGDCTISAIDTVWLGSMPLQRYICGCSPYRVIIEGVGSTAGFITADACAMGIETYTVLVCYSKQYNTVQVANGGINCNLVNLTDILPPNAQSLNSSAITVTPNPTQNQVTVTINGQYNNSQTQITLCNTMGQVVKRLQTYTTAANLDLTDLPTGLYFIEISSNGLKQMHKILKM